jgi:hypothetical protein
LFEFSLWLSSFENGRRKEVYNVEQVEKGDGKFDGKGWQIIGK